MQMIRIILVLFIYSCQMPTSEVNINKYPNKIKKENLQNEYKQALKLLKVVNYKKVINAKDLPDSIYTKIANPDKWEYKFGLVEKYDTIFTIFFVVTKEGKDIQHPSWFPIYNGVAFHKKDSRICYFQSSKHHGFHFIHKKDTSNLDKTWQDVFQ